MGLTSSRAMVLRNMRMGLVKNIGEGIEGAGSLERQHAFQPARTGSKFWLCKREMFLRAPVLRACQ